MVSFATERITDGRRDACRSRHACASRRPARGARFSGSARRGAVGPLGTGPLSGCEAGKHTMSDAPTEPTSPARSTQHMPGMSSLYRLCEEVITLRETTNRQHKLFEQTM